MSDFCKLFEDDLIGQILVVNDDNEDGKPEVKFSFTPKHLGVCSFSVKFPKSDDGYADCDKAFDGMDKETSVIAVRHFLDQMKLTGIGE